MELYREMAGLADAVSYSYKTNPYVGDILRDETDCHFSIHTPKRVAAVGDPSRIWYFAQGWNGSEIEGLLADGVRGFVVDNRADLETLWNVMADSGHTISLLLRLKLKERTVHTGKHYVFGMRSQELCDAVREVADLAWCKRIGIHFHRKTQNVSEWSLLEELQDVLSEDVLQKISIVNMGGGLPSVYRNFRTDPRERIFKKIRELYGWLNSNGIRMIIEPGRYIAAPSMELHATVLARHEQTLIVDCSIFNGAMDTFLANIRLPVKGEKESGEAFTVKGKTPDSVDIFRYRVYFDAAQVGDTLVFENAGAYIFATDFCGLDPIPVEIIE